ncbi:MAG TPA: hypothetical protein VEL28_16290 [Candidatus Binatia bacterium]|nr:hypothetical protein [Candidatus Binatia bacterium]
MSTRLPLLLATLICSAACEDPATTRARVFEAHRKDTYARCLAHGALDNYRKQCEQIGGRMLVVRHTHVCFGEGRERNPEGLGDGPFCVCHQRNAEGRCIGEADCDAGVKEKCEPLLSAELVPFYKPPADAASPAPAGSH